MIVATYTQHGEQLAEKPYGDWFSVPNYFSRLYNYLSTATLDNPVIT